MEDKVKLNLFLFVIAFLLYFCLTAAEFEYVFKNLGKFGISFLVYSWVS